MIRWSSIFSLLALSAAYPQGCPPQIAQVCVECHDKEVTKGGLDLTALSFDLNVREVREQWIRIHDRIEKREMPPKAEDLPDGERSKLVQSLASSIYDADAADVVAHGRGPLRRLNRDEYEQNLRDALRLPELDIRDILPEDREGHHFNKTAEMLDMSRVQLAAYLDAAETALRAAMVTTPAPPEVTKFRAIGTDLFPSSTTFGEQQAMFFAKDNRAISTAVANDKESRNDPGMELALFRSAHWPYFGYPRGFVAKVAGEYQVRFSARAVLQQAAFKLIAATRPVPMTFRARKPSGPDVSGDVRATGGIMDVQPDVATYETRIQLRAGETFEYSLLGLPVPLARNVKGGPPTYRYPPFPAGGQPGVAFQWLEVEGPLPPEAWPPECHRVLFGDDKTADPKWLLRHFVKAVARGPIGDEALAKFDVLIQSRRDAGVPFREAMLAGYQAFLCSGHVLYLREPEGRGDSFAVASRLSHFLTNSRPDAELMAAAEARTIGDPTVLRSQTDRLMRGKGLDRFIKNFTDYWLNLRHIRRDEPDIRLYPEYRFDDYLVESMAEETRAFVRALIEENLPARTLLQADFVFANDRLAAHYGLPPLTGSQMRKVSLPQGSVLGGLLTQAAILKVTANGTTTSPVVRGAWIMDRIIGQPPPAPPTSVPAVEPDIRGAKTIRDLLALHTRSKSCAGCHARFDPVGLALENFDILGGWRTRYRGMEEGDRVTGIDRAGHDFAYTLAASVDPSGNLRDGRRFESIGGLRGLLASDNRQLARNLLHQLTVYSTGVPVRFSDRREIEAILDQNAAIGYPVRDLIHSLVQSQIFLGVPR